MKCDALSKGLSKGLVSVKPDCKIDYISIYLLKIRELARAIALLS
jgi:hypothetical protein